MWTRPPSHFLESSPQDAQIVPTVEDFQLLPEARGVGEDMLSITLQLNEPGTAYCAALRLTVGCVLRRALQLDSLSADVALQSEGRATRTDAASTALHISHIVQAGFYATNDVFS